MKYRVVINKYYGLHTLNIMIIKFLWGEMGKEGNHAKSNNSKMPSVGDNDV